MKEKVGVFLSRMQPLHIGHLGMIEKALSENDKVIILIGSADKKGGIRNQIPIDIRREILEETLKEKYERDYRIKIKNLPDWTEEDDILSNLEWGRYLYYNIASLSETKEFTMYFSDEREIIENWFQDETIRKRINIKTYERKEMFEDVSSTKIRNAFLNNDKEYVEKSTPNAVIKRYEEIRAIINKIYENPKIKGVEE